SKRSSALRSHQSGGRDGFSATARAALRNGTDLLPTPAEALDEPFSAFPSWFLRITCDRCGKDCLQNEARVGATAQDAFAPCAWRRLGSSALTAAGLDTPGDGSLYQGTTALSFDRTTASMRVALHHEQRQRSCSRGTPPRWARECLSDK